MTTAIVRGLSVLVLAASGAAIAAGPGRAAGAEEVAAAVAADLAQGRLAAVAERFTPEMARALPLAALTSAWGGIIGQSGAVRAVAPPRVLPAASPGLALIVVPMTFERARLDLKLSLAGERIAGLFLSPSETAAMAWQRPDYADPAAFADVAVMVGNPPRALGGTLTLPKTAVKAPAVVLIHGSGPLDRDETIGPNRPFRDIAEGLASRGIAVLRYDKRSRAHPDQFVGPFTVREEAMDDAAAAIALLVGRPEIDTRRIVLVGHSLGGMLAPRIAAANPAVAGVVIMAGAARPLPMLIVEQTEYLASLHPPGSDAERSRLDDIKAAAARAMAARRDDSGPNILGAPAAYWADLNAYDPAAAAAQLSVPVLVLQGGRDYQVTSADFDRFRSALAGRAQATIRLFSELNHLFMAGEGRSRPEEYQVEGHVDRAAIETIADFVTRLPP